MKKERYRYNNNTKEWEQLFRFDFRPVYFNGCSCLSSKKAQEIYSARLSGIINKVDLLSKGSVMEAAADAAMDADARGWR